MLVVCERSTAPGNRVVMLVEENRDAGEDDGRDGQAE